MTNFAARSTARSLLDRLPCLAIACAIALRLASVCLGQDQQYSSDDANGQPSAQTDTVPYAALQFTNPSQVSATRQWTPQQWSSPATIVHCEALEQPAKKVIPVSTSKLQPGMEPIAPAVMPQRLPPSPNAVGYPSPYPIAPTQNSYYSNTPLQQVATGSPDEVRVDWNCAGCTAPHFDVAIDTIFWRLEDVRGQPVALNPVADEAFSTDGMDLGFRVGPRVDISYMSDEGEYLTGFNVGYFGVYNWNATRILDAAPGTYLRLPDTIGNIGETVDFATADSMALQHRASLNSAEANLIFGDPMASFHIIAGIRFLRLDEGFNIYSFTDNRLSGYEVETRNELWGAQIGGTWRRSHACWDFSSFIKVGAFNNNARQQSFMTDNDRTEVLRDFNTRVTTSSFVLDSGLSVGRWINDVWLVRVGYSVVWLNHVARAPDQLDFSANAVSGSRMFFRQDALAHGLNIGLEATW